MFCSTILNVFGIGSCMKFIYCIRVASDEIIKTASKYSTIKCVLVGRVKVALQYGQYLVIESPLEEPTGFLPPAPALFSL